MPHVIVHALVSVGNGYNCMSELLGRKACLVCLSVS